MPRIGYQQYLEIAMKNQFSNSLKKLKCITEDHTTTFETKQNFTFCMFEKIK